MLPLFTKFPVKQKLAQGRHIALIILIKACNTSVDT